MPSSILHPPPSYCLSVASRQRVRKINRRLLKEIGLALLADLGVGDADLGIQLVAAPEMIRLNEQFLRHAGSTDVITFDYLHEDRAVCPQPAVVAIGTSLRSKATARQASRPAIHGDIFICVDEAVRQARKFGTRWQSEVVRYLVHGVLHLLGFDDSRTTARRKMKREENRRLRALACRFPLSKL